MAEQDTQPEEPQEGAQGDESSTPEDTTLSDYPSGEHDVEAQEPTTADYQEAKPQADASTYADAEQAGYFGTLAEVQEGDPNAIKTVGEAAPDGAEDEPGYFGMLPEAVDETAPVKMADQEPPPEHLQQTEESVKGYVGTVPTSDAEREAMTLTGQARIAREQYGDGRPEGS